MFLKKSTVVTQGLIMLYDRVTQSLQISPLLLDLFCWSYIAL